MNKQKGVRTVYILYTVRRVPAVSLWKQSSQVLATYQQAVSSNVCVPPVVLKPKAIVWFYNKCHVRTHIECLEPVHLMLQWVTCVKLLLACIYTYLHIYIYVSIYNIIIYIAQSYIYSVQHAYIELVHPCTWILQNNLNVCNKYFIYL